MLNREEWQCRHNRLGKFDPEQKFGNYIDFDDKQKDELDSWSVINAEFKDFIPLEYREGIKLYSWQHRTEWRYIPKDNA